MSQPESSEKPTNSVKMVEISAEQAGQRLDNYLLSRLKGVPKSHIYRLLRSGQLRVNKGRKKPGYRLQAGDLIRIPPLRTASRDEAVIPDAVLERLRNAFLFENSDILVLNKPAGIAVHGGSELKFGIIEAMRQLYPGRFFELVHRLDRDTSGCLVLARNRETLNRLHQALRNNDADADRPAIEKTYLALLAGLWQQGEKTIDLPLLKVRRGGEHRVEVSADGQRAVSHFKLVQHYRNTSLMQVNIDTGRTHQIRVHAAASGHPVAGDNKYGDAGFNREMKKLGLQRLFLHASHIVLPLGEGISVHAPLSEDLSQLLDNMAP
jgi:23S rRNA pseudouridine955/2504/2580 synthase